MKKKISMILFTVVILMSIFAINAVSVSADSYCDVVHSDINGDGLYNNDDYNLMIEYLAGADVGVINGAVDVNGDDSVNCKDLVRLLKRNADEDVQAFYNYSDSSSELSHKSFVYGKSELGRDLICHVINGTDYEKTILLNFAIHGFEDSYDADAQVLVDAAKALISYYEGENSLNDCRLLIVPCANPDGLYDGITNNGFGRCNANGIDLNRDFDANYVSYSNVRNYTPYAFSAAESRALRDLCNEYDTDIVIDFHGWLDLTIGDSELAEVFYKNLGLSHSYSFTSSNASGYFANWAHQQGALGLLVEFTSPNDVSVTEIKAAINDLIKGNYDDGSGDYAISEKYGDFTNIQCYTLSTGRITTYAGIGIPFSTTSYIDGSTDLCTIQKIYENGWVKVNYPISGGNKTAYCYLSDFIDSDNAFEPYPAHTISNTAVYTRSDLSVSLGSVWSTDTVYVVADNGSTVQVLYPLDAGGWKMGWISRSLMAN